MPAAIVRRRCGAAFPATRGPGIRAPGFRTGTLPRPGTLVVVGALLCGPVICPPAHADAAYIIDELRVPLRATACPNCPIVVPGLKSGQQVKILETGDGWTRVESDGVAGWLPSRYLSAQPIARDQLAVLHEEIQRLQAENLRLAGQSGSSADTGSAPVPLPAAPADNPGDAGTLRAQNQELLTRNKMLQSEIDVLHATKEELQSNDIQRWFVFGGLLVALGALLGTILPLLKPKRRRYSEWS